MALKKVLQPVYSTELDLYELGWTMVHTEYRGNHFAQCLLKRVCSYLENMSEYVLAATVHPLNDAALKVYLEHGLKPVFQTKYYGYDRVFLIKEVHK